MKKRKKIFGLFGLMVILLYSAGISNIFAQKNTIRYPVKTKKIDKDDKNLKLKKIIEQIHKERESYYKIKNEWEKEKAQLRNEKKIIEKELKYVDVSITQETETLKNVQKSLAALRQDLKGKGVTKQLYSPIIWDTIKSLEKIVKKGLPFKLKERIDRIGTAKTFISDTSKSLGEKFRKIWDVCTTEMDYASSNELYTGKIEINGEKKVVKILRLGTVCMYYKTSNDKEHGILLKENNKYVWDNNLTAKEIKGIKDAFNIVNKRKSASVIHIPITQAEIK